MIGFYNQNILVVEDMFRMCYQMYYLQHLLSQFNDIVIMIMQRILMECSSCKNVLLQRAIYNQGPQIVSEAQIQRNCNSYTNVTVHL